MHARTLAAWLIAVGCSPLLAIEPPGGKLVIDLPDFGGPGSIQLDLPELPGELDLGPSASQANPIVDIAQDMSQVVKELDKAVTGEPTQNKQQAIVNKLDDLIAQLEKECEACRKAQSGASSSNPTSPLSDSVITGGPGGQGDLRDPRQNGRRWGDLPPRERERIVQSLTEGFPPHYRTILERYYRRLAEEESAGSSPADAPATDSP